ncbi:MAG: hypothetical protein WA117_04800 [Verrucomicrobiia bacterium]
MAMIATARNKSAVFSSDASAEFCHGSYLPKVEGDEAGFDLAAPSLRSVTREEMMRHVDGKPQAALAVEGRPLLLFIED